MASWLVPACNENLTQGLADPAKQGPLHLVVEDAEKRHLQAAESPAASSRDPLHCGRFSDTEAWYFEACRTRAKSSKPQILKPRP